MANKSSHIILLAAGIGITPILSMARKLALSGRPFELHYAAASASRAAYMEEVRRLNLSVPGCARFYFSNMHQRMDARKIVSVAPPGAHIYACGPERFMQAVATATSDRPPETVHTESFHPIANDGDQAFVVKLKRSGMDVTVEANQTILDAVRSRGIDAGASCEQGVCVLDGIADHRDTVLSDQERAANKSMMICCSRSRGGVLTLDL